MVFSLTIIESFRFEDENKYECEIFARSQIIADALERFILLSFHQKS